jgi:hypothetical protein
VIYIDDILCMYCDRGTLMGQLDKSFNEKEGSIIEQSFYLGVNLKNIILPNGVVNWGIGPVSMRKPLSRMYKSTWIQLIT